LLSSPRKRGSSDFALSLSSKSEKASLQAGATGLPGVCPAAWTSAPLPQTGARIHSCLNAPQGAAAAAPATVPHPARSVHTPDSPAAFAY